MTFQECLPYSGNIQSNIAFVYDKPTQQDFHFGGIFENRGCFFAKKTIEKYFNPLYTAILKCDEETCDCVEEWKEEVKDKYVVAMGMETFKKMGYKKAKFGDILNDVAFWYSPELFLTRGDKFVNAFDKFCKGVSCVVSEKNS